MIKHSLTSRGRWRFIFYPVILIAGLWVCHPVFAAREAYSSSEGLTPVILIPGLSRSVLRRGEDGPVVWGNWRTFFAFRDQDDLALPIESSRLRDNQDDLIAHGLMDKITIIPFLLKLYSSEEFFKNMKRYGYKLGDMDNPRPGDNFFVFLYDWRRDNVENAQLLAAKIERLKAHFGQDSKFDVIASCAASLMARYYVLYGGKDVLEESPSLMPDYTGADNIRKLLLVSPPHRGTAMAFQVLHRGYRALPVPLIRKYTAYEAFTAPAFFELLPPPGENVFVDGEGNSLEIDLYDPQNWLHFGWSVFSKREQRLLEKKIKKRYPDSFREKIVEEREKRMNYLGAVLKRAKLFHAAIDEARHPFPERLEVYSFLLTGFDTLDKIEMLPDLSKVEFGKSSTKDTRFAKGDSIITFSSMRGRYLHNPPHEILAPVSHRRMANDHSLHERAIEILVS